MSSRRTIVLDTSAFVAGFNPSEVDYDLYSVPDVERELIKASLPEVRFQASVEAGKLRVQTPDAHHVDAARKASKEVGDILYLSETDILVLALAAQLKDEGHIPTIVTDDYSMQKVATKIGVNFTPLATLGIRFHLQWLLYCPACRRKYPSDYKYQDCEVCGTRLKRKPQTKRPTNEPI
jgi:UPF0271 protein